MMYTCILIEIWHTNWLQFQTLYLSSKYHDDDDEFSPRVIAWFIRIVLLLNHIAAVFCIIIIIFSRFSFLLTYCSYRSEMICWFTLNSCNILSILNLYIYIYIYKPQYLVGRHFMNFNNIKCKKKIIKKEKSIFLECRKKEWFNGVRDEFSRFLFFVISAVSFITVKLNEKQIPFDILSPPFEFIIQIRVSGRCNREKYLCL